MPQKSIAQNRRLSNLLQFSHKVKTALSLPWDNPNNQRDELDDNAGLAIVHQKPTSVSTAAVQYRSSLVLDDLRLTLTTTSAVGATPSKSPNARGASEITPW